MKKIAIILSAAVAVILTGCKYEDPLDKMGTLPQDRITPSGVEEVLLTVGDWKVSYDGHDYYFSFTEGGAVSSNSDFEKMGMKGSYEMGWSGFHAVTLTLNNAGHLAYSSASETVFVIEDGDWSEDEISATGAETDAGFVFVPATAEEVKAMADKDLAIAARLEAVLKIRESGLTSGVVSSGSDLAAHWYLDVTDDDVQTIRLDILSNRVLSHKSIKVDIDNEGVTFSEPVSIGGKDIKGLLIDFSAPSVSLSGGAGLSANFVFDNVGEWYIGKDTGYRTYKYEDTDTRDACDAIKQEIVDNKSLYFSIELSDRENRPFFCIPANWDDGRGYVAVYSNNKPSVSSTEKDRVYLNGGTRMEMPYGGDAKWQDWIREKVPVLIDTYFSENGIIVVRHGEKLYYLSPVNENWFQAYK